MADVGNIQDTGMTGKSVALECLQGMYADTRITEEGLPMQGASVFVLICGRHVSFLLRFAVAAPIAYGATFTPQASFHRDLSS